MKISRTKLFETVDDMVDYYLAEKYSKSLKSIADENDNIDLDSNEYNIVVKKFLSDNKNDYQYKLLCDALELNKIIFEKLKNKKR